MPDDPVRRVLTVLGCLASDSGLGGALLFDLDPVLLGPLAFWMQSRMPSAKPRPIANLSALRSVDELWCRTSFEDGTFTVNPGLVVEEGRIAPPILLIPDLMRLRPTAARVAVSLIGATAAVAEVADHSLQWRPRGRWLAAVDRSAARRLSPHLLDRFTLRADASELNAALMPGSWLAAQTGAGEMTVALGRALAEASPGEIPSRLTDLALPPISAAAATRVISQVPPGLARRDLAVARVARVLAAWEEAPEVDARHVDRATELLGHRRPGQPGAQPAARPPRTAPPPGRRASPDDVPVPDSAQNRTAQPGLVVPAEPARPAGEPLASEPDATPLLYPEDSLTSAAELDASRISRMRPRPGGRRFKGHVVGSLPGGDASDLAMLATVLEAAKFQGIRRKNQPWNRRRRRFRIIPSDLRRPRYLTDPGDALVLVLDHSCWRGWNRAAALAPYLRRAAEQDSSVSVIEFGFDGARSEFTAERYRAPSLHDPKVVVSLSRSPGRASPLAHALDLALSDLRRRVRRTVSPQQCLLVVATDGRGNIPLDASLLGQAPRGPTGRTGITDAERVAERIAALPGVEIVVIMPDLGAYRELPFNLADGLGGAPVRLAPRIDRMEG